MASDGRLSFRSFSQIHPREFRDKCLSQIHRTVGKLSENSPREQREKKFLRKKLPTESRPSQISRNFSEKYFRQNSLGMFPTPSILWGFFRKQFPMILSNEISVGNFRGPFLSISQPFKDGPPGEPTSIFHVWEKAFRSPVSDLLNRADYYLCRKPIDMSTVSWRGS